MIGALLYKDYKLICRNQIGTLLIQYVFLTLILGSNLGLIGYGVIIVAGGWTFLMETVQKEQLSFGRKLLYAASYTKEQFVLSHYIGSLVPFFLLNIWYVAFVWLAKLVGIDLFQSLTKNAVFLTFGIYLLFISVTMPCYYIFSATTTQVISIACIFIPVFGGKAIAIMLGEDKMAQFLQFLEQTGHQAIVFLGILLFLLSERIVVRLEKKQE